MADTGTRSLPTDAPFPPGRRRIPRWKIAGGIALHGALPAYPVALLGDWLIHGAPPMASELTRIGPVSTTFLALYSALALAATGTAALIDHIAGTHATRLAARPPALAIRHRDHALAQATALLGAPAPAALHTIASAPWNMDDPRWQALAEDLAALIAAHAESAALAPADRQAAIRAQAAKALDDLAMGVAALAAQSSDSADDRALAMANYVRTRYGKDIT